MSSLQRFIQAQLGQDGYVSFQQAYEELKAGRKQSHWIWYIFPQMKQLGFSSIAQHFGIVDLKEACEYLQNDQLFQNYDAIIQVVEQQLKNNISVQTLMNGDTDAKKLVSSLTLFRETASFLRDQANTSQDFDKLAKCCDQILLETSKQDYLPCERTLDFCQSSKK